MAVEEAVPVGQKLQSEASSARVRTFLPVLRQSLKKIPKRSIKSTVFKLFSASETVETENVSSIVIGC